MAIDFSDVVNVTIQTQPTAVIRREFGRTLFLDCADDNYDQASEIEQAAFVRSVRTYKSANELGTNENSDAVNAAANAYFAQQPQDLVVGTVLKVSQSGLISFTLNGAPAAIQTLHPVGLQLDDTSISVDVSSVTTDAQVIDALREGLINAIPGATITPINESARAYTITIPPTFNGNIEDGFNPSDAAETIGLVGSSVSIIPQIDKESITQAMDRILSIDCSWYWIGVSHALLEDDDLRTELFAWVGARPYEYSLIFDTYGENLLIPNENTSYVSTISASVYPNVAAIYNGRMASSLDYKSMSLIGAFSAVNFALPNSQITGKFLSLPGRAPTVLTSAQRSELIRKRVNFYSDFTGTGDAITAEGQSFGTWIDAHYWLSWFRNAIETAIYNTLRQSNRIPLTDAGVGVLFDRISRVADEGIRNGGIAAGVLSEAARLDVRLSTGNANFDGTLANGYLLYFPPVAQQPASQRAERKAPPFKLWVIPSSAIHSADIAIIFEG